MLNIALCDDDLDTLKYYSNKISELAKQNNYTFKIKTFRTGENLLFELEDNPNIFNILIIDIVMKNIDGIKTTEILRKYGYKGMIIFLTSSKDFALDSFKVEPLSYILKNDDKNYFDIIFLKAAKRVYDNVNKNIIILSSNQKKFIDINDILYIESFNKKVILNVVDHKEKINYVLKDIYEEVKNKGFIRCHKSYIVNLKYLQTFNKSECRLKDGSIIPIGRKYSKSFKNAILENEFDNIII